MATLILAGDIGGTHSRLGLFQRGPERPKLIVEQTYDSRKYATLTEIIRQFLNQQRLTPKAASLGVAGPVVHGRACMSNRGWCVDAKELTSEFGIPVVLLNDLEAQAYALDLLQPDEFAELNAGRRDIKGNMALIAPGTGLGEAGLYWDGACHHPMASEAGHADFAPSNEIEDELLRFLRPRFGHVSYERVVSGPGLLNIYSFLAETGRACEPEWLRDELRAADDPASTISHRGVDGSVGICHDALAIFVSILAAEAGNAAVRFMATGGLFLGGGIPRKILPQLKDPSFVSTICNKGRLQTLLKNVSIRVILNDSGGIIGAARHASLAPHVRAAVTLY